MLASFTHRFEGMWGQGTVYFALDITVEISTSLCQYYSSDHGGASRTYVQGRDQRRGRRAEENVPSGNCRPFGGFSSVFQYLEQLNI